MSMCEHGGLTLPRDLRYKELIQVPYGDPGPQRSIPATKYKKRVRVNRLAMIRVTILEC